MKKRGIKAAEDWIERVDYFFAEVEPAENLAATNIEYARHISLNKAFGGIGEITVVGRRVDLIDGHVHLLADPQLLGHLVDEVLANSLFPDEGGHTKRVEEG